jgi:Flp pilus assembly protein TadG
MKIKKHERGQSLVELALSLVVLLFLLSGVVEFGIAFFQFIQLRDAAQEGALYGSINPADTNGIVARVRNASGEPIDLTNTSLVVVTITITDAGTPSHTCPGDGLQVDVDFDHQIFMPFLPALINTNTIHLTGSVTDTILNSTDTACP